jgi:hypothetical protein
MEEGESHDDLSNDIPDHVFSEENFLLAQVEVQVSHGEVLHDDVDVARILEGFPDAREEEVVLHLADHLALQHVVLSYLRLVYYLHRVTLSALFLFHQYHTSERTLSQVLDALVVRRTSSCFLVVWL